MRLMKLRELSDENKSKSHGNVTRSTSAYGDNKYVGLSYYVLKSTCQSGKQVDGACSVGQRSC